MELRKFKILRKGDYDRVKFAACALGMLLVSLTSYDKQDGCLTVAASLLE